MRLLMLSLLISFSIFATPPHVRLDDQHLFVDGKAAPFLFGAEVQYFRARGGAGRNVPAATVTALWNKLLDRVVEAKMNSVIFYIPWDFHEPKEGVFDFDGTLDQDGDGKPDYPSRNLKLFLQLVEKHGIRNVMLRPGPYINAEWGPTGFGAVPLWFLNQYPQALALNRTAGKAKVVSFAHPIFRKKARRWMKTLYEQVLKGWIGPGKPVTFLQLDNETNFFWDSVYERDRSADAMVHYHRFLRARFHDDLAALNSAYGARVASFEQVNAPDTSDDRSYSQARWHYDWYLFHDLQIAQYHQFIRQTWESLGIREPNVIFTTCDSFNALNQGLLPRLDFRGEAGLSLSTMNVYPKTAGTQAESTLNQPMKAAHDAALFAAAHAQIYGNAGQWVMATETVGGWFPPVEVSLATRQHTYASLLGAGVKAMIIYYFHEGYNWSGVEEQDSQLSFDAPLDANMNPRASFALLKNLGERLQQGLGSHLSEATAVTSPILIAHDDTHQYLIPGGPNAQFAQSDELAGIFGWFREAGYLPEVGLLDRLSEQQLQKFKVVVWNDVGYLTTKTRTKLANYVRRGGEVIGIGGKKPPFSAHHFAVNPALNWNTDGYLKQPDVTEKLKLLRDTLQHAGLNPLVEVTARDHQPFVHAWMRKESNGHRLLFVENFLRVPREIKVSTPGVRYRYASIWTSSLSPQVVLDGSALPVSADGVDIWDVY